MMQVQEYREFHSPTRQNNAIDYVDESEMYSKKLDIYGNEINTNLDISCNRTKEKT